MQGVGSARRAPDPTASTGRHRGDPKRASHEVQWCAGHRSVLAWGLRSCPVRRGAGLVGAAIWGL